jgi:hypothetical protein
MSHVFISSTGFGVTLVPIWPYGFARSPHAPDAVAVSHWADDELQMATLVLPPDGSGPEVTLIGAESVGQVVEVRDGPADRVWRIETSLYSVEWPAGFEIAAPPANTGAPFDLTGPDEAMIFPQGPLGQEMIPAPAAMAGPGQTIVEQRREPEFDAVHLDYEHEGGSWRQSHYIVPCGADQMLVITAQSPAVHAALTREAAESAARSVRVRS